jgi:hypothetical protein
MEATGVGEDTSKKKGLISMIRESLTKTGGCCCGPGETCGSPAKTDEKAPEKDVKHTDKPAQK